MCVGEIAVADRMDGTDSVSCRVLSFEFGIWDSATRLLVPFFLHVEVI
jgi:hypothetical protein